MLPVSAARECCRSQPPGGNPGGGPFGRYPFGVSTGAESHFGIAIPTELRAGWWWGTARQPDGEFLRAQITAAGLR